MTETNESRWYMPLKSELPPEISLQAAVSVLSNLALQLRLSINVEKMLEATAELDRNLDRKVLEIPPSERNEDQAHAARLIERLSKARIIGQGALEFLRSAERIDEGDRPRVHGPDAARCTGRTPAGTYCDCQLGRDLRIVEARNNPIVAPTAEGAAAIADAKRPAEGESNDDV